MADSTTTAAPTLTNTTAATQPSNAGPAADPRTGFTAQWGWQATIADSSSGLPCSPPPGAVCWHVEINITCQDTIGGTNTTQSSEYCSPLITPVGGIWPITGTFVCNKINPATLYTSDGNAVNCFHLPDFGSTTPGTFRSSTAAADLLDCFCTLPSTITFTTLP